MFKFSITIAFIVLLIYSSIHTVNAQCNNPTPIGSTLQEFCAADGRQVSDLIAVGGLVDWYPTPVGGLSFDISELLVNGIYYADDVVSGGCSVNRLEVEVNVYAFPPSNVNVQVTVCENDNPTISNLSAIGQNIEWYTAETGGSIIAQSTPLVNLGVYWVQQTVNSCVSIRKATLVNFINVSEPIFLLDNLNQDFCSSDMPMVSDIDGEGMDIIWYSTANAIVPLNMDVFLVDGEDYWAATNLLSCESVARTPIRVSVDQETDAGEDVFFNICVITLAEGPINLYDYLGGNPDIGGQWTGPSNLSNGYLGTYVNGINTSGDYTYVVASLLGICSESMAIVTINELDSSPPITANVTQEFCDIDSATIADLQATGTSINWYASLSSTAVLDSTILLIDGMSYYATQTNAATNCESSARLEVVVQINTTVAPITTNSTQEFCEIDSATVADLQAMGVSINWYDSLSSTTALLPTTLLIDGMMYYGTQTNAGTNCESRGRLEVVVQINITVTPTTANQTQEFCDIDSATIANLQVTGTSINWYASPSGTTVLDSTILLIDGMSYYATQTNVATNCESSARLEVVVQINTTTAPTTTNMTQEFCDIDSATVADLQATGTSISWYDSLTSTIALVPTTLLIDGMSYYATQTDAATNCESSARLEVVVQITTTTAPTTTNSTQEFCEIDNATVADLQAMGVSINWYDSLTSTTALVPTTLLIDGMIYYGTQTNAISNCESRDRLEVVVQINITVAPTTANLTQEFCDIDIATVADLQATGTSISWYDSLTSTIGLAPTTLLIDGMSYYASQTDAATNCESSARLEVVVQINTTAAPTTANSTQEFCEIDSATVADLQAMGVSINWYDSLTSTTALVPTTLLIDGMIYYGTQTNAISNCESRGRLEVVVQINITVAPTTANLTQEFCDIDSATVADLQATGTSISWYDSLTSTIALVPTTLLIDGMSYYATQTDAATNCESSARLEVVVQINTTPAPTTTNPTQEFCDSDVATVADLQVTGTLINWYGSLTSTTVLAPTTLLIDGISYYATQTDVATNCESSARLEVVVQINAAPAPPSTDNMTQEFCEINFATVADLQVTGVSINWYDSLTSTTVLDLTTLLINGMVYYATQTGTVTNCESTVRLEVTVQINYIPAPTTVNMTQELCESDIATVADLQVTGTLINWYDSLTSTTVLAPTALLIDGMIYYATQTDTVTNCESAARLEVVVQLIIVAVPELIEDGNQLCIIDIPTIGDLSMNIISQDNLIVQWYDDVFPTGQLLIDSVELNSNQTYYAIAIDANGCQSSPLIVNVSLDNCDSSEIIIYDGFSPNGDGVNDTFLIKNINFLFPNYTATFYNRWGNSIYSTNANKPEWNGMLRGDGEQLPIGVYYYVIDFNDNLQTQRQGRLYLSR